MAIGPVSSFGLSSQLPFQASGCGSCYPGAPVEEERKANAKPELTEEQEKEVEELKKTDREVRTHEQAHVAAGGGHVTSGPTFEYTSGPDGKRYAVGGEVQIDTSPIKGDPQATIAKMQQVRKAALAPANPSAQDRAIAAKASAQETKARRQIAKEQTGQASGGASETGKLESAKHGNTKAYSYANDGVAVSRQNPQQTNVLDLIA